MLFSGNHRYYSMTWSTEEEMRPAGPVGTNSAVPRSCDQAGLLWWTWGHGGLEVERAIQEFGKEAPRIWQASSGGWCRDLSSSRWWVKGHLGNPLVCRSLWCDWHGGAMWAVFAPDSQWWLILLRQLGLGHSQWNRAWTSVERLGWEVHCHLRVQSKTGVNCKLSYSELLELGSWCPVIDLPKEESGS